MAAVDPYAPCPCGSGQKFKWCCHKVESYADKAQRLLEGGQVDAALASLDEGLKKVPSNPWLANRKAAILIRRGQSDDARTLLDDVVARNPKHVGSRALLVRSVLETSGPQAAADVLQLALNAIPVEARSGLAIPAQLIGMVAKEVGFMPAARMHFELALALRGGVGYQENQSLVSSIQMIEADPEEPLWLRNPDRLSPAPENLGKERRSRFDESYKLGEAGLWNSAAAGFELLAGDGIAVAERNLGLCRLWTLDLAGCSAALKRYVESAGETTEAVDLEALRQLIAPLDDDDLVEELQLIWTLRDRARLLGTLKDSDRVDATGLVPLDPEDEQSVEVESFHLLDRPKPAGDLPKAITDYPRILGRVLVGQEIVILEGLDDGRLDELTSWFTDLAGDSVPPAQPKSKEVAKLPRHLATMRIYWWLPENSPPELTSQLQRQERARVVEEVWPNTPMPYLGNRTPQQVSGSSDPRTKVALRGAVLQYEMSAQYQPAGGANYHRLREKLGIAPEPEVDPDTVDLQTLHLARLHLVPADRLDDDRLVTLLARARNAMLPDAIERAARAIVERPHLLTRPDVGRVNVFQDLANLALGRGDAGEAASWLRRGRESDPDVKGVNSVRWALADLRLREHGSP